MSIWLPVLDLNCMSPKYISKMNLSLRFLETCFMNYGKMNGRQIRSYYTHNMNTQQNLQLLKPYYVQDRFSKSLINILEYSSLKWIIFINQLGGFKFILLLFMVKKIVFFVKWILKTFELFITFLPEFVKTDSWDIGISHWIWLWCRHCWMSSCSSFLWSCYEFLT